MFQWGSSWPPPQGAGNYSGEESLGHDLGNDQKHLPGYRDSFPTTAPVMSFSPNKLGLYDLDGNAREWVLDWYDNEKKERVLRGGSWYSSGGRMGLRLSDRGGVAPDYRWGHTGFRVVLASASSQPANR
jgi:formylglycine-generating enzyme required for sulfatase activity